MGRASFRLPHGYCRRVAAIAQTCDDTTNDEMLESECGSLQSSANNHDSSTDEDDLSAAERVSDEDGDDCAEKTAQVVRGDSNTLVSRPVRASGIEMFRLRVDSRELVQEDGEGQNATHDTLICQDKPC